MLLSDPIKLMPLHCRKY